ncbi:ABC transporter ATP-binding protein [Clostridiales bacterium]|nr:ABC transporter ATP-binding protein [Clostridiales bacterium]
MDLVKDSMACTFTGNMKYLTSRWREGLRSNGRKEKKYLREKARAEKRAAKGKTWTVPAPTVIDMDTVSSNMERLISGLKDHYEERIAEEGAEDKTRKTEQVIRDLEEKAAGMAARMDKWTARNKALKLMEEVGISEPRVRYRQYPFEFSGGMRQRIVIAIALAADPDILICDEPTTALDVTIQAQILELINSLKEKRNLSIIFITHDLGVVANMADRIAVMYAGKIVEYGTSEEIFYAPAHPYTWALLSSMPDLDTKEKLEAIPGTPPNMIYPPKGDAFAERNRYAMEIDFEQEPPVFPISETHWAATWLLHPDAPKVDPPAAVTERIRKMKARAAEVSGNE